MLGFKGQYVCPIGLLSHRVVHCDPITLGGGGTIATVISTSAAYAQHLPLNSGGFLLLRARRRQAVCLGTINGRGGYVHVPGPRRHLCV